MDYVLPILTTTFTLFLFAKDWDSHKKPWRRRTVLCLIVLIGLGGIINAHYIDLKRQKDGERIINLKEGIDAAVKMQENNTKQFVDYFDKLSQKLSGLETQIKTTGLQQEADQLRTELKATQKAMISPKAQLAFSFETSQRKDNLVRVVTLPVTNETVHIEFTVRNPTDVPALNGELTLIICDACTFVADPPLFTRLAGQPETQRNYKFDRILPKTELRTLSADIKVPPTGSDVELLVDYRCVNCVANELKTNKGTIKLSR